MPYIFVLKFFIINRNMKIYLLLIVLLAAPYFTLAFSTFD
jgi:hypothetical protein